MQKLDPQKYGTAELDSSTARETSGGWVGTAVAVGVALALSAADHSDEISEGFDDAYNPDTE
jgi:hypothetical protein